MLIRCGAVTPNASLLIITLTSLQSPPPVPSYIHYTPSKGSNVNLEFDFPISWILKEERPYSELITISLVDPRFLALPNRLPNAVDSHPTGPDDFGKVIIWVSPDEPGQTPDSELESLKVDYSNITWMTVLDDYKTTIDGYKASVMKYQAQYRK